MSDKSAESGANEPKSAGEEPVAPAANEAAAASATEPQASSEPQIEPAEAPSVVPEPKASTEPAPEPKPVKTSGQIMVMPPVHEDTWSAGPRVEPSAAPRSSRMGRAMGMAAVVVLAAATGAIGAAVTTTGIGRFMPEAPKAAVSHAAEDAIARIDTEIAALRTSFEHSSKYSAGQFTKANDRLDKIEKAQAEPSARLAKLNDAVEKLRTQVQATTAAAPMTTASVAPVAAAPAEPASKKMTDAVERVRAQAPSSTPAIPPTPAPVVVASAAPKDATGIAAPAAPSQAAGMPAPKTDVGRLPTVDGWVLRDVGGGGAVIESRRGMFEVYAGDNIPGLGRIDAVRRQDGRWVVVTSRGLIISR